MLKKLGDPEDDFDDDDPAEDEDEDEEIQDGEDEVFPIDDPERDA